MRSPSIILTALLLCAGHASGQTTTNTPVVTNSTPAAIEDEGKNWSFSASVHTYLVPNDTDYAQPAISFDNDWLHLEARYNYEELETGSAWFGYNFSGGDKVAWEFTPMIGGIFGRIDGVAPGYKGLLTWWKLELYSEGEYMFDVGEASSSFLYNWSELTIAPLDWLRVGMVTQRTRVYEAGRDIQRGFLVGLSYKTLNFTTYVFNPDQSKPTVVLAAGVTF